MKTISLHYHKYLVHYFLKNSDSRKIKNLLEKNAKQALGIGGVP